MTVNHPRSTMSVPGDLTDIVKPLADADGMTVGSWIRRIARQEAHRRTGVVVRNPPVDVDVLRRELRRSEYGRSDDV